MVRRRTETDTELNLSALIDIFSNMLFFLMTTVTFLTLKTLNAAVPALSTSADVDTNKGVNVSIEITADGYVLQASGQPADVSQDELKVKEEIGRSSSLVGGAPKLDTKELTEQLWEIKKKAPEVKNIMIFPAADVPFDEVIVTMDASREMPSIIDPRKRVPLFTRPVLSELIKKDEDLDD